jgi:hypothetical protein
VDAGWAVVAVGLVVFLAFFFAAFLAAASRDF